VLDANTVEWIKNNGGLTRANGDRFRATLLSRGGSKDALQLFRDFTNAEPRIEPLLVRRGLTGTVSDDSAAPETSSDAPTPPGTPGG
jgi:peptidyl-dipeptidase Dcp